MFARASSVFLLALPVLAAANALPRNQPSSNQCDTGSLQCCNSVQSSSSSVVQVLLGLLGVALGSVTGNVGVTCSPISVIGASGTDCNEQPVCCTDDSFNGVIALGCSPINLNL